MTAVVIDASAGVEIVTGTARGRRLSALMPEDAEGWVPQHFYVEVAGVIRHRTVIARTLPEAAAATALDRLQRWHLHQAVVPPLLAPAWQYRHNMTTADAVYVALAVELGAPFLSDDQKLMNAPTFPKHVTLLRLPLA